MAGPKTGIAMTPCTCGPPHLVVLKHQGHATGPVWSRGGAGVITGVLICRQLAGRPSPPTSGLLSLWYPFLPRAIIVLLHHHGRPFPLILSFFWSLSLLPFRLLQPGCVFLVISAVVDYACVLLTLIEFISRQSNLLLPAMPSAVQPPRTLYDKVFQDHIVEEKDDGTVLLYIGKRVCCLSFVLLLSWY